MEKNKITIDLVEHAQELKEAGVDSYALLRAGLFIACLYAYDLGIKPIQLTKLLEHIYGKICLSIKKEFYQQGTDTEQ
jgi:hypothetical protein